MREYSKETIEALDGSIEKWFNITFRGGRDRGIRDCPLCDIFNTSGYGHCSGCPIADHVNYPECGGWAGCIRTPYKGWLDASGPVRKVHDHGSAYAAYQFYKWLQDLRANVCEMKEEMTYKRGDLFRSSCSDGLYVLASVGYPSKFNLIRLDHPHIGKRMDEPVEVANPRAITQAEIDKIPRSISVEKVEGVLTFMEGKTND